MAPKELGLLGAKQLKHDIAVLHSGARRRLDRARALGHCFFAPPLDVNHGAQRDAGLGGRVGDELALGARGAERVRKCGQVGEQKKKGRE